jgi:hypothetical protein
MTIINSSSVKEMGPGGKQTIPITGRRTALLATLQLDR